MRRLWMATLCGMALYGMALCRANAFAQATPVAPQSPGNTPTPPPPLGNTLLLWPNGAPGAVGDAPEDKPRLEAFPVKGNGLHTAVIVAPGGGYTHLAYDKEGVQVAKWFNDHGVSAFVLTYRLSPRYAYPLPLLDGKRAIRWVRSHAQEYGIDPTKIGILGFSAGGHLVGYLGTHFDGGNSKSADPIEQAGSRPDFVVACYGLLTLDPTLTENWSLKFLVGDHPSSAVLADVAPDTHVTAQTPPFFIWSTTEDKTINSINSTHFYEVLKRTGIPAELHVFETGPHGTGLSQQYPALKLWPQLMGTWMQSHGWMP